MGIILLLVFLAYLVGAGIVIGITAKCAKSKKTVWLVALFFVLFPFRRLIFYETLFAWYSRTPLQEIHETVENPESVYWEDNVWPGFDEYGRHWMVKNYLDGVHLKVLALNGDDGRIYLYRADDKTYVGSIPLIEQIQILEEKKAALEEKFRKIYKKEFLSAHAPLRGPEDEKIKRDYIDSHPLHREIEKLKQQIGKLKHRLHEIKKRGERVVFTNKARYNNPDNLPPMRYHVRFDPLPLPWPLRDWLHADRLSIVDNRTGKEIAFSRRYMVHHGFISQISGEQPKFDYKLGDTQPYEFDDKVLFGYGIKSGYDVNRNWKFNTQQN